MYLVSERPKDVVEKHGKLGTEVYMLRWIETDEVGEMRLRLCMEAGFS